MRRKLEWWSGEGECKWCEEGRERGPSVSVENTE